MSFQLNLDSEQVTQASSPAMVCVEPTCSLREVFLLMQQKNSGSILVCRDGQLCGIFTERDAVRLMAADADMDSSIEQHMVADPVTLQATDTVGTAISMMSSGGYRRMPIVDDEQRPVGIVKVSGILHYLVEHFPSVIYNLPPKPHHSTQQREGA